MARQIGLQLDSKLSTEVIRRANEIGLPPEALVMVYLKYATLRHEDVIKFERAAGNEFIKRADAERASRRDDKRPISEQAANVANNLLRRLRPDSKESSCGTSPATNDNEKDDSSRT